MGSLFKASSQFFLHGKRDILIDDLTGQFAQSNLHRMPYVGVIPDRYRTKVLHVLVLEQDDSFSKSREKGN